MNTIRTAALAALLAIGAATSASAVDCDAFGATTVNEEDGVMKSDGCFWSGAELGNDSEETLNGIPLFNLEGWKAIAKEEFDKFEGDTEALKVTGNTQSGYFDIDGSLWTKFRTLAVVLKAASDKKGFGWFAYDLADQRSADPANRYAYKSIFEEANKGNGSISFKNISHIALYGTEEERPGISSVPGPASGLLMLSMLGMGAFAVRRRRRAS